MRNLFTLIVFLSLMHFAIAQEVGTTYEPVVTQNAYFDVSQPLYEIGPIPPKGASGHQLYKKDPSIPKLNQETVYLNPDNALPKGDDPAWQKDMGGRGISPPFVNFEGIRNSDNGAPAEYVAPPDTDGDVGPNHYFHMCNTIFEIFDKGGTSLFGPADNSTIWDGFVGDWTGTNDGDPITLYDEYADRWLVSQFAINTSITGGTFWVLVAISTSPNPMGSYYRYAFQFTNFPDYPKFGVWRDGYYLMVQHGNGTATAAALNRTQMLAGNATAQMVSYAIPSLPGSGFSSVLPADNDGTLAPSGSPNYFVYFSDDAWGSDPVDRLKVWEFKVNWTFPWLSTLTFKSNLNTTAFDSSFGSHNQGIIPQPGTTQRLAVMEKAMMNRLQYRNFGSYQSMVCCHTVDVNGSNRAGVRWYELRKTTGDWYIYQQGTYAPGTTDNYWMASIAQNGGGDIALGFSVSSSSTYPSVRYTGRKLGDPLGQMTMAEQTIMNGSHSQGGTARWGDYSRMSVDPTDDETFWYTNQYLGNYHTWGAWITRVGAFVIDSYCDASGGCDEYIANVQIGTINNSSGCSGYANYTAISTDLPLNATHLLTVTNGSLSYPSDQCGVWIDWNRDEDFNDAGETITVSGTPGVGPYTANITPPATATLGPVRMRVRITYTGSVSPCGATTYGEVEDYTINLTPKVPNVWTGAFNSYWHNAGNWSLGHIPTSDEDVIITSAGYQPPKVDFYDEACNNLTIESGELVVKGYGLLVNGNLTINGKLSMDNTSGLINVQGNVVWNSGSTASFTASPTMWVYGNWNFNAGANAFINAGAVFFLGSEDKYIRSYSSACALNQVYVNKTLDKELGISALSTQTLKILGILSINSTSKFGCYTNHGFTISGNIFSNGIFQCSSGTTTLAGTSQSIRLKPGDYFSNLTFNQTGLVTFDVTHTNIFEVKGNVVIQSGTFSMASNTLKVGGNWNNNVGTAAFNEGSGRVIFNGAGHQYVYSSETFNILEANMGASLRITNAAHTVTCNQYEWTTGGIDVIAGTFTALDLAQNGIFGGYWLNPGGVINLTNNDGWVDLNANVNIYGGEFNVYGGTIYSYWPYSADATLNMSGGVLDFKDQGILIYNTAFYSLNDNITGGIIRTSRGFTGSRADFTPTAGTFEFYGTSDYSISQSNGCTLRNVVINKDAKEGGDNSTGEPVYDERSGELLSDGGKANTITLGSNFVVTGNLTIEAGSFNLASYTCNVSNTTTIYGHLIMTNAANDLTTVNMYWENGSSANVTAGTFHAGAWAFREGTTAKLGTGNTTYITSNMLFPTSNDAEFGNLVRGPLSKNVVEEDNSKAYYPVKVMGNLLIKSGASLFYTQAGSDLLVAGNAVIEGGSSISFSAADFQVDGTLDLSGSLAIFSNHSATVLGELTFPASSWLYLSNGTFSCYYDVSAFSTNLGGKLTMNEGSLFEFPGRGIAIGSTFVNEITGGTLRFGRTFTANSAGTFTVNHGTVEFVSSNTGHYIQVTNGNYVNNLIVNKPGGSLLVHDHLTIKGDLTINAGTFNSNNKIIWIAGDWLNNVGPSAFAETNSRVIFNGTGVQFCTSEDFYILEVDKPVELLYNVSGHNITCQIYDWTNGGLWISPGNFTAYDLADNGLFGTFAIFDGVMNLYQEAGQYVDVNGDIIIGSYGQLNIYGGWGPSYWPYAGNASIVMSGEAVLDFKDAGILLYNSPTYSFSENITGGTIRTPGSFQVVNSGFTPTGGTIELYGGNDAFANQIAGTYFNNLLINKIGGDGSKTDPITDRDGKVIERERANLIWASSDLLINGDLTVEKGTLHASGNNLTLGGNVVINSDALLNLSSNSTLSMASAKTITVNNGGMLGPIGNSGNEARITRTSSGFYALNIESGGTIAAEHAFFEYMNTSGVNVKSGAIVDPTYSFNNCTFRYGQSGGRLLTINNNQSFEIHNATFPPNVWGGTYNAYKSINAGQVTFVNAVGPFAGTPHEHDPYNRIFWGDEPLAHNISLPAGWSGLSSYLMPTNTDITDIFAPVFSSFITAQTMTAAYYPAGGVNTIGNWLSQSAYKVKMSDAAMLPIVGFDETNKIFPLATGWNLVPVICNVPVSAVSLFTGTNLTIAKDVAGVGVYWPAYSINTLGNLLPGSAYYALLGSPGSVTFPPNAKDAWSGNYPEIKHPDHFWNEISVSSSSHLIAIEAEGLKMLEPGDIIGVFSPQGDCHGVAEINDLSKNGLLTAYADDPITPAKDGFVEMEPLTYKVLRPSTAQIFDVEAEYNLQLPQRGNFAGEGLSAITMLKLTATGITGDISSSISIYPNPTDGTIRVAGISNFDKIELIGSLGSVINTIKTDGQSNLSIDLTDFQPGVYQIKLTGEQGTYVKRVVKN